MRIRYKNMAKKQKQVSNDYLARIKVIGIGGGGGNVISRMREKFNVKNIDFIAVNTDAQDLDNCNTKQKIYIGKNLTRGLGTGMNPDIGRQAAEENRSEIIEALKGADLVFLTAGLGGGTGSGGIPVIAEVAREIGALTIAAVTKPFSFEGAQRNRIAQESLVKLKEKVDSLIVIPNDRIFSIIRKETPIIKAFEYIDDVLRNAIEGIAETIAIPGIINIDFADIKTIMQDSGAALVGIGVASGQDRTTNAASQAINSPLLEVSIEGAKGILFTVGGNKDLKLSEINDMATTISGAVDPGARIIFGAYHTRNLAKGQIKVTLIATGFNGSNIKRENNSSVSNLFSIPLSSINKNEIKTETSIEKTEEIEDRKLKINNKIENKKKKSSEIWDIPTFLRKKKK